MGIRFLIAAAAMACVAFCATASADIIVDHPPHRYGGPASDTAIINDFDEPYWQRVADEVQLSQPATITHISWLGFYHLDNPPAEETMRIRLYRGRGGNGLPDENQVYYEQAVNNPSRVGTGHIVADGIGPQEYRYDVNLDSAVSLSAGTLYWLEVAQMGDFDTWWRWESSVTDGNGHAFINPATHDWRHTPSNFVGDTAFQLIGTPEPSTALFFFCTLGFATVRRAPRRMPGVTLKR